MTIQKGDQMASVVQENRVYLPEETKDQNKLCLSLMLRLAEDVLNMEPGLDGVRGKHRMKQDIIRLRRELLRLSKMIDMTKDERW